eukprot:gene475-601_t
MSELDPDYIKAIKFGHLQIIKNCTNFNGRGLAGESYLHLAASAGNESIIRFLLNKISVDVVDVELLTPLHHSCLESKYLAASVLLQNKADPNALDKNGESPLYLSALQGSVQCIKVLLLNGANINIKSNSGDTALHIAIINHHLECIEFLIQNGADYNIPNNKGKTAKMLWLSSSLSNSNSYLFHSKNVSRRDPHQNIYPVNSFCTVTILTVVESSSAVLDVTTTQYAVSHIITNTPTPNIYSVQILIDFPISTTSTSTFFSIVNENSESTPPLEFSWNCQYPIPPTKNNLEYYFQIPFVQELLDPSILKCKIKDTTTSSLFTCVIIQNKPNYSIFSIKLNMVLGGNDILNSDHTIPIIATLYTDSYEKDITIGQLIPQDGSTTSAVSLYPPNPSITINKGFYNFSSILVVTSYSNDNRDYGYVFQTGKTSVVTSLDTFNNYYKVSNKNMKTTFLSISQHQLATSGGNYQFYSKVYQNGQNIILKSQLSYTLIRSYTFYQNILIQNPTRDYFTITMKKSYEDFGMISNIDNELNDFVFPYGVISGSADSYEYRSDHLYSSTFGENLQIKFSFNTLPLPTPTTIALKVTNPDTSPPKILDAQVWSIEPYLNLLVLNISDQSGLLSLRVNQKTIYHAENYLVRGDKFNGVYYLAIYTPVTSILENLIYLTAIDLSGNSKEYSSGTPLSDINLNTVFPFSQRIDWDFQDITYLAFQNYTMDVSDFDSENFLFFNVTQPDITVEPLVSFSFGSYSPYDKILGKFQGFWDKNLKVYIVPFYVPRQATSDTLNFVIESVRPIESKTLHSIHGNKTIVQIKSIEFDNLPPLVTALVPLDGIGWNMTIEDRDSGFSRATAYVIGDKDPQPIIVEITKDQLIDGDIYLGVYEVRPNYPTTKCVQQTYSISKLETYDLHPLMPPLFIKKGVDPFLKLGGTTSFLPKFKGSCIIPVDPDSGSPYMLDFKANTTIIDVGSQNRGISFTFKGSDTMTGLSKVHFPKVYLGSISPKLVIIDCKNDKEENGYIFYKCEGEIPYGFGEGTNISISLYGLVDNALNYYGAYSTNLKFQFVDYRIERQFTTIRSPNLEMHLPFYPKNGKLEILGSAFGEDKSQISVFVDFLNTSSIIAYSGTDLEYFSPAIFILNLPYVSNPFKVQIKRDNSLSNQLIVNPEKIRNYKIPSNLPNITPIPTTTSVSTSSTTSSTTVASTTSSTTVSSTSSATSASSTSSTSISTSSSATSASSTSSIAGSTTSSTTGSTSSSATSASTTGSTTSSSTSASSTSSTSGSTSSSSTTSSTTSGSTSSSSTLSTSGSTSSSSTTSSTTSPTEKPIECPNNCNDSKTFGTETSSSLESFIAINIPFFNNLTKIDPDYSVILDVNSACSSKFSKWKIIVISCTCGIAFLAMSAGTTIYFLKKKKEGLLKKDLKIKLNGIN